MLFTLSVSVAVLPSGSVNVHGLFGEIKASVITEDKDRITEATASEQMQKIQKAKGMNVFNRWFELWILVTCICFVAHFIRLPRRETIVTLKVRMDN